MDDKFSKISDTISNSAEKITDVVSKGYDKISDSNSEKDYQKRSEKVAENSTGGAIDTAGSIVQGTGEKINKIGDETQNIGQFGENVGKTIESTGKGVEKTGEAVEKVGQGMQQVGQGMQQVGQSMQQTGQSTKEAGSAVSNASSGMIEAGAGASATGVGAVGGVPLAVAGAIGKVAGTGAQIAGTGADVAGKGVEASGKGLESAGQSTEKAGQSMQKAGDKMQKSGQEMQKRSQDVKDIGKKISDRGKGIKEAGLKAREAAMTDNVGEDALDDAASAAKKIGKEIKKDLKDHKKVLDSSIGAATSAVNPLGVFDMAEGTGALFRIILRRAIIIGAVLLLVLVLLYEVTLGPIMEAMDKIDQTATNAANFHERMDNYLAGLGFQNSEEAFHEELDNLYNEKYNKQLDIPYIMATLFFDDIQNNGETIDFGLEDTTEDDGDNSNGALIAAKRWIKEKVEESNKTIGEDGLIYSSNKVYRLRKLARHQFDNPIFGSGSNVQLHTVSGTEYLEQLQKNFDSALYDALIDLFKISINDWNFIDKVESLYQMVFEKELFSTTDTGGRLDLAISALKDLLDVIFSPFFDIESVTIDAFDMDCDVEGLVCVKYKTYGVDLNAYESYLRKYYIRYMPEFKKYIDDSNEEILEKSIDAVIEQIKEIKDEYEEIFGVPEQSTEYYSNICTGNIKKALLNELVKPVDIDPNQEICFSGAYGFGTSSGMQHRGVDINEETTGNHEGDSVYSIYSNGKVVLSTKDGEVADPTDASGGTTTGVLEIEYDAQLSDGAYKFKVIYEGLNPSSIELKTGDTVQKGEKIGVIGGTPESGVSIPSLHFGIYDITSGQYLDPTNLFVDCGSGPSIGNGSEEDLWKYLKDYGLSDAGAAGVLGNWVNESGYRPNNLEDGCERQTEYDDATFTEAVNSGKISLAQWKNYPGFTCEGSTGIYGYGLAQWTYHTRKEDMWNFWKESGTSIDDLTMQLEFFKKEVETGSDFRGLLDYLKTATDPREAALKFREMYERGVGIQVRADSAEQIYNKYKGTSGSGSSSSSSTSSNPSCYNPGDSVTIESLDNFFFIGDSRYVGVSDQLSKLGNNINVQAVSSSNQLQWYKNITTGEAILSQTIIYPTSDKVSGISVMLGVNTVTDLTNMKNFLSKLHEKYPNVQIYVNSLYHVSDKYHYSDYKQMNNSIDSFNTAMQNYCKEQRYLTYIDVTSGLYDSNGLPKNTDSEGLHLTGDGKTTLVKNIKDKILSSSAPVDNSTREKLVEVAKQSLGVPYSQSKRFDLQNGVDCSGFMYAVYKTQGIDIPTNEQYQAQASNMKIVYDFHSTGTFTDSVLPKMHKGDLIFFENKDSGYEHCHCYKEIGHVGMYIGNGEMIHAGNPVQIVSLKNYGYEKIRQVSSWNGNKQYDSNKIVEQCRCSGCPNKCW